MKPRKPDRSVSKMDVLKDIRGLLSTTQEREDSAKARLEDEGGLRAKTAWLEEEVKRYKELVQKQQDELHRLESEKKELAAKLNMLCSGKDKPMSPAPRAEELCEEIAQLEARKAELSSALSQVDGLLQLRVKELLKRIARLYQEAGQGDIAMEFRRAADELEVAENFAHFLRALLNQ
jgi:DNA repair exonuclease SbcCD ATPase subunit